MNWWQRPLAPKEDGRTAPRRNCGSIWNNTHERADRAGVFSGRSAAGSRGLRSVGPEASESKTAEIARGTRWLEDLVQDISLRHSNAAKANPASRQFAPVDAGPRKRSDDCHVHRRQRRFCSSHCRIQSRTGWSRFTATPDTWNAAVYGEQNVAYPDFLDCQRSEAALWRWRASSIAEGILGEPGVPEYVERRGDYTRALFSSGRSALCEGALS